MNSKYILIISALIATSISALVSIIPIGLFDQSQVSAFYPTLFTPDTFTFSIWSIIYLSWITIGISELFGRSWVSKENAYLLAAAQILSSLWLLPAQYLWIGSSLIVMLWVLYLLTILLCKSREDNVYFKYVTELFFGWILIASIANIHLVLVAYDLYFIPLILTQVSICIWLIINVFLIKKYASYIPSYVLIWALIGIISAQSNTITQIVSWLSILTILLLYVQRYKSEKK